MNEAEKICYWLQGYIEITGGIPPSEEQWEQIKSTIKKADITTISDGLMKPEAFITWISGYIDLTNKVPSGVQWDIIREHLQLVFVKITSDRSANENEDTNNNILEALKKIRDDIDKDISPWNPDHEKNPWRKEGPYTPITFLDDKKICMAIDDNACFCLGDFKVSLNPETERPLEVPEPSPPASRN